MNLGFLSLSLFMSTRARVPLILLALPSLFPALPYFLKQLPAAQNPRRTRRKVDFLLSQIARECVHSKATNESFRSAILFLVFRGCASERSPGCAQTGCNESCTLARFIGSWARGCFASNILINRSQKRYLLRMCK